MKTYKIVFWVSTVLFALAMLSSAYMYITAAEVKGAFQKHLGIPDYLRIELAIAKFLGASVLLLPFMPKALKYFAYAGFLINLISAVVAHSAVGDSLKDIAMPVIFILILATSFYTYQKLVKGIQSTKVN